MQLRSSMMGLAALLAAGIKKTLHNEGSGKHITVTAMKPWRETDEVESTGLATGHSQLISCLWYFPHHLLQFLCHRKLEHFSSDVHFWKLHWLIALRINLNTWIPFTMSFLGYIFLNSFDAFIFPRDFTPKSAKTLWIAQNSTSKSWAHSLLNPHTQAVFSHWSISLAIGLDLLILVNKAYWFTFLRSLSPFLNFILSKRAFNCISLVPIFRLDNFSLSYHYLLLIWFTPITQTLTMSSWREGQNYIYSLQNMQQLAQFLGIWYMFR